MKSILSRKFLPAPILILFYFLAFLLITSLSGCTKSDSGDDSGGDENVSGSKSCDASELCTKCGLVVSNQLVNNISREDAELVNVEAIDSDIVAITRLTGEQAGGKTLVKLQGVTASGVSVVRRALGRELIDDNGFNALFVSGGETCNITLSDGGKGVIGQVFSSSGSNLSELLIQNGYALPSGDDSCGGGALTACYGNLEVIEQFSDDVVTEFLWKPVSDSDGKLAIHSSPFNLTVKVSGASTETRPSVGSGNGFGSLSRFSKPGCAYGNNVKVEFFDELERKLKINNGDDSITVPQGCARFEQTY